MYKTKMIKVYSPIRCILSLIISLVVLEIQPSRTWANPQSSSSQSTPQSTATQAANPNTTQTAEEILSEINRVRTNPQGYAQWLEEQRQYYDGIWLRLPGERPVRTNKGQKALEEAIAILKEQKPLSALDVSKETAATAITKLENFATANNIQYISYGRVTAKGIVMSLVVDDLFPDRRRRNNLLSPDVENTGVVCKPDPRYAKVCAIAYSDFTNTADIAEAEPQPKPTARENPTSTPNPEAASESQQTQTTPAQDTTVTESLPQPPQPQAPPAPSDIAEATQPETETDQSEPEVEVSQADPEPENEVDQTTTESEEAVQSQDEEDVEMFEAEQDEDEVIATNSDTEILERVERGLLEEGDRIIEEDGSFYDSYPIQGQAGDSITVALESEQFDAFVAIVDSKGNIVEQNDDISEENSNSQIQLIIPEDGIYNVIVNAYDEGGQGEYVLTVRR
ncbi:pre-peptidase C-terminal domain-containing protein [Pleurocapsales cyanobacterium LEGE 10410]|nr:pre-peptidase C-terminal domain-containing protein [Pleurocapsales cyanobacterium LEGE 10410]